MSVIPGAVFILTTVTFDVNPTNIVYPSCPAVVGAAPNGYAILVKITLDAPLFVNIAPENTLINN